MGLEAIVSAIAAEAATQVAEIRAGAERQVAELLDEARIRADLERRERKVGRDAAAERARARIVNRAHLEADRLLAEAREEMFQEALVRLHRRLEEVAAGDEYPDILRRLLAEATAVLHDEGLTIRVRATDGPAMQRIVAENSMQSAVDPSLECLGGLDLETADGRAVRNTVAARLVRAERQLRLTAVEVIPELATGRAAL